MSAKLFAIGIMFLIFNTSHHPGEVMDMHNGVPIFFNGKIGDTHGRHLTPDGYNLGLKWQCVEYVKRYYYQVYNHKMPYTYGHAKDLFDNSLEDVAFNEKRGLLQFRNVRYEKPKPGDMLVYDGTSYNQYGHTGIISRVSETEVELMQQNYGKKSRDTLTLSTFNGIYTVADYDVLGWLRMP